MTACLSMVALVTHVLRVAARQDSMVLAQVVAWRAMRVDSLN